MGCSRVWGPQHSSRKQESGYLEKGGFELDFKGLSHQEGNEICPWLMETGREKSFFRTTLNREASFTHGKQGKIF